jgi:hypothetical protein
VHRVYRLLKHCSEGNNERDEVVRFHAQAGLGDLDRVVRGQFEGIFESEKVPQVRIL